MTTAPAPRSSGAFQVPAAALPIQLTQFIGREAEIAAVGDLLRSARLVTLTGVGGAGKTRLAAEVAARAAPLFEATAWVDLASLSDPALVCELVATGLGFREEGGRSAVAMMVSRVSERSTFVILDNCEHLVDACATLADSLLKRCPRVRILATSREALGVSGEQAWLVPPLSLPAASPTAAAVLGSEAGQLFLARARAVLPSFTLDDSNATAVAQICRRLDGIPLAIELAAARVRVLAPDQIAGRLDEAFTVLAGSGRTAVARHRTLREAIDWSYALLDEAEAALFRRLAVFAGTFSLDAVEAVCPDQGLDVLSTLVDKSLVVMESTGSEARYRLLETLRQYARDKLVAAGEEAELCRRHARFFTDLVAAREKDTFGGAGDPEWSARLAAEEPNLRAACDWAETTGDYTTALRLGAALHWHWYARGHFREGWQRLETALGHAEQAPPLDAGKAYVAAATTAFFLGKLDQIVPHAERGVALLRDQDDPWHLAYALTALGFGLTLTDPVASEPWQVEATALTHIHAPRSVLLIFALYWQGRGALGRGDLDSAERLLSEAHGLGRALGHPPAIAHPLASLGLVLIERGALGTAATHLRDALRIHARNSDLLGCLWSLEGLARIADRTGSLEQAVELLTFARLERDRIGAAWSPPEQQLYDAVVAALEDRLGADRCAAAAGRGVAMSLEDAVALALETGLDTTPPGPVPPVHTLTVQALGPLRISKDGTPLDREAWASAKPRELLLFLLCHPEGCTREQVGVAFWPEASAEQVRNSFHVTLHRLRKTMGGPHWVTLSGDRYALDAGVTVEFDAATFEREVADGLARLKRDGDTAPLEAAIALYRGDFLEHEAVGDWHVALRDRLRLKYLSALTALADHAMRQERWAEAADAWRTLIARDGLDERAYRGLMTCHARLGERSQVQQLYKRLEQVLQRELEARPEPETTQLYHKLVTEGGVSLQ
jgi:predicted ATPase/DNA-binding SARP family transcriptional activator